jgi:acetoin utilization protein AcuB
MLITDWMTRSPVTILPDAPLREAMRLLRQHRIRHLPVVSEGKLCGVLSDRDIKLAMPPLERSYPPARLEQMYDRRVSEIMTKDVLTVAPGDSLLEAARLMRQRKISCLPVIYNNHLVGILTETDILDALLSMKQEP